MIVSPVMIPFIQCAETDDGVDNNCDGLEAPDYSMCSGSSFKGSIS